MRAEIKARWVERLRTTPAPQVRGHLGNVEGGRCCLGVLSDIAVEDGVIEVHPLKRPAPCLGIEGMLVYGGGEEGTGSNTGVLPEAVRAWAGLSQVDPEVPNPNLSSETTTLTILNDGLEMTFPEIADVIERNL